MAEAGRLVFTIILDGDGKAVIDDLNKIKSSISQLEQKSTSSTSGMSKGFSDLWKGMAVGFTAANIVSKGFEVLAGWARDSAKAFLDAELAQSKLNVVLKGTGEIASVANKQIGDFAEKMQYLTGIDSDQVKGLEILARQYEIQTDRVDEAVQSAIALTQIAGSLEGNLKAVADAYNGNWRSLGALIPAIKSASSDSERMDILQRKLAEGMDIATESMKTNSGAILDFKNNMQDLGKAVFSIVPEMAKAFDVFMGNSMLMKKLARERFTEELKEEQALLASITKINAFIDKQHTAAGWNAPASPTQLGFIDIESDLAAGEAAYKDFAAAIAPAITKTKELTEAQKEAAAIVEKYGLNIQGLNEAGREQYFQIMQAVGILPRFTAETQAAADAQAHLGTDTGNLTEAGKEMYIQILRMVGILPKLAEVADEVDTSANANKKTFQELNAIFEFSNTLFKALGDALPGIGKGFAAVAKGAMDFTAALETSKDGVVSLSGGLGTFFSIGLGVMSALTAAFGNFYNKATDWAEKQIELQKIQQALSKQTQADLDASGKAAIIAAGDFGNYIRGLVALGGEGSAAVMKLIDQYGDLASVQKYVNAQMQEATAGYADYLAAGFSTATIDALDEVLAYQKKVGENQVLIKGVEGMTTALVKMSNGIELNETEFDKFEQMARDGYDALIARDFTERQSLTEMAPMLSRLVFLQKEYGLTIDAATQALIDKAKAEGVNLDKWKSQDELFSDMAGSLEELVKIFRDAFPAAVDKSTEALKRLNDNAPDLNTPGQPHPKQPYEEPAAGGWQGWVAGGSNKRFVTGEREPEYVSITPMSKMRGSDAAPGGRITNINIEIKEANSPETAASNIITAYRNNTRGLRSLLEN